LKPYPSDIPSRNPFPARVQGDVDGFGRSVAERETASRVLGGSASAMDGKRGMYAVGDGGRQSETSAGKAETGKRAGADEASSLDDMLRSANEMKLSDDEGTKQTKKADSPSSSKPGGEGEIDEWWNRIEVKRNKLGGGHAAAPSNQDRQAKSEKSFGAGDGSKGGRRPSKSAVDQLCAMNNKNPGCLGR
ncbi:MAG: hypothetical protein AAB339_09200, partial [Elusimicrobiota bacterium]